MLTRKTGENICLPTPFDGRLLAIPLAFKNRDNNGKIIKRSTKLLLCSIYHPLDNDEYECFNTELTTILGNVPSDRSIIIGHDITLELMQDQDIFTKIH